LVQVIAALVVKIFATNAPSFFINAVTRFARCEAYASAKVVIKVPTKQLLAVPLILTALRAVNRLHLASCMGMDLNLLSF